MLSSEPTLTFLVPKHTRNFHGVEGLTEKELES